MKLLIIASHAPSLTLFRGPLIARLTAMGVDVHACAPPFDDATHTAIEGFGATFHPTVMQRTGRSFMADIRYKRMLQEVIREQQPDLVLTYTIKPNIWGAFAAAAEGVRSVAMMTGLGYAFTDRSLRSWPVRQVARRLYRRATSLNWRVIFQNPDDIADFVAAGCLTDQSKTRIVNGSGVDLTEFPPTPLPETPEFVMIARLLAAKGTREFAHAAREVRRTHPEAKFTLVGPPDPGIDGIPEEELQRWIDEGLNYHGLTADVRPFLNAGRVFVLPSYREGTPRSVLEAMAVGRPIITSDAPGCRETVTDGVNGFLVPPRNATALAEKMRWMLDNPEAVNRMAEESLAIARDKYDVEKVNDALIRFLEIEE